MRPKTRIGGKLGDGPGGSLGVDRCRLGHRQDSFLGQCRKTIRADSGALENPAKDATKETWTVFLDRRGLTLGRGGTNQLSLGQAAGF